MIAQYRKSIAALLGSLATWGIAAGADGHYSQVELWGLLGALGTVVAVWGVSNAQPPADPAPVTPERLESTNVTVNPEAIRRSMKTKAPGDPGHVDVATILIALAVSIIVLTVWVQLIR